MYKFLEKDTIVAIATPPGKSAIGVVRVSGRDTLKIVNKLFSAKDLFKADSHTIHFGILKNEIGKDIDQVLVSLFKKPKSYTGEDVVEISCHGSIFILNEIVRTISACGARLAEPGEFTFRAFMNRKLDLSQAEGVADIIDSESRLAHEVAINQVKGGFAIKLKEIRDRLLHIISLMELELDFAEEDVEFATNDELKSLLDCTRLEIEKLAESFRLGNVIKKGVAVVIAGRPNAGKSTLLNTLLNEEKAITSKIPGTTRDLIEDVIHIEGILFRFIDTAGLAETENEIERIGIERTIKRIAKADILLYLFDTTLLNKDEVAEDIRRLNLKSLSVLVANKLDKLSETEIEQVKTNFSGFKEDLIFISSKFGDNIENLKKILLKKLDLENFLGDYTIITNERHYRILKEILSGINDINKAIAQKLSKDFIAIDARRILNLIGEITGEVSTEEILGNIFSRFCIGK
jgi:tRNA modification GTPase